MKKFMILMLSLAVLFSFAACDNSTTPAGGDEDTTVTYPVSEANLNKEAADFVVKAFYSASDALIDVKTLIGGADQYNSEITDAGHLVVTSTSNAGKMIGTVTVDVWGSYKAKTESEAGSINAYYYTVASDGAVQLFDSAESEYKTVTFSLTGSLENVSVAIPVTGQYTVTAISAKVYAPLVKQDASITMDVITARDADGVPVIESKTFSDESFKNALIDAVTDADPVVFVQNVAKNYLSTGVNDDMTGIFTDVNTILGGKTVEGLSVTANWEDKDDVNTTDKVEGVFTLTLSGKDYKFGTSDEYKMNGDMTITFAKSTRGVDTNSKTVTLTGAYTIGGEFSYSGDYPVEIVIDSAYPITGTLGANASATLKEAGTSAATAITGLTNWGSFESGKLTIEGTTLTI